TSPPAKPEVPQDTYEKHPQSRPVFAATPEISATAIRRRGSRRCRICVKTQPRRRTTNRTTLREHGAANSSQTAPLHNEAEDNERGDVPRQTALAVPQGSYGRGNRRPRRTRPRR